MRHRRHRRSWTKRLRRSFTGFGVVFVLALVLAIGLVWGTVLPALQTSFSIFSTLLTMPDPSTLAELQRKGNAR